MRRSLRARRLGCLSCCAGVLAALAVALPAAGVAAGREPLVTSGEATAEIRFPTATRHVVVLQEPGKVRRLYAGGDIIFHPQEPARSWTVDRVTAGALILRDGSRGRQHSIPVGKPIPGFAGLLFTGTLMLEEVHYRYRAVERIAQQDPVLVSVEGSRAILEVEVVRSSVPVREEPVTGAAPPGPQPALPPRAKLDAGILGQVRVTDAGAGIYEVNAADVRTVFDNTGRVLADLSPIVLPILSAKSGVQYRITSAASDGVISSQGYTVIAPKLAERAGIEAGDTILSVNGRPVDGLGSLYRIYREIGRDSALTTIRMEVERQGTRLTKTYRIR